MIVTYKTKKLRKLATNYKHCQKELGQKCAKKFMMRINALKDASTLEDTRHLPGRFHTLLQNRKGQWGCDLEHPKRLVFEPSEKPIPIDENGFL
jgi:proteic killer suppression protein